MASKKDGNKGSELTDAGITEIVPVKAPELQGFVENIDATWLEGIKIARIVKLDDGQGVRGIYMGLGANVEVHDPTTGEVRDVPTHLVEVRPDVMVRLIESSQLKRELAIVPPGTRVRIMKIGQVDTRRGRRVNDYIVAVEPAQLNSVPNAG